MKEKKTVRIFTAMDWQAEQNYLREQHKNGWKYKRSGFMLYHFEKCEPEDVIYQLDFNSEGTKRRDDYLQMFKDCGWEYIQEFNGYTFFRKPVSQMNGREEEIFCDDESRLEMIRNVLRKKMLPLLYIFFLIIIPQIIMLSLHWYVGHGFVKWLLFVYIAAFVLYLIIFIKSARVYLRFKRQVKK